MSDGAVLEIAGVRLPLSRLLGRERGINALPCYEIELKSSLVLSEYLSTTVTIQLKQEVIVVILTEVTRLSVYHQPYYRCLLQSPMMVLSEVRNRVFSQLTLEQVIKRIIQENDAFNYPVQLVKCPPIEIAHLIQYQESDLDFWQRLCRRYSIYYHFVNQEKPVLEVFWEFPNNQAQEIKLVQAAGVNRSQLAISHLSICYFENTTIAYAISDDVHLQPMDTVVVESVQWRIILSDIVLTAHRQEGHLLMIPVEQSNLDVVSANVPWQSWFGYQPTRSESGSAKRCYRGFMLAVVDEAHRGDLVSIKFDWQHDEMLYLPRLSFNPDCIGHQLDTHSTVVIGFIEDDIDRPIIMGNYANQVDSQTSNRHLCRVRGLELLLDERKQALLCFSMTSAKLTLSAAGIEFFSTDKSVFRSATDFNLSVENEINTVKSQQTVVNYSQTEVANTVHFSAAQMKFESRSFGLIAQQIKAQLNFGELHAEHCYGQFGECRVNARTCQLIADKEINFIFNDWQFSNSSRFGGGAGKLWLETEQTLRLTAEKIFIPEVTYIN